MVVAMEATQEGMVAIEYFLEGIKEGALAEAARAEEKMGLTLI